MCHPPALCKNCGHTVLDHFYTSEPIKDSWCPKCRGCGPHNEEEMSTMGVGRKGGRPDRSHTGSDETTYVSCAGGCGARVEEGDGSCSNCRIKLVGGFNNTAGTGHDSCARAIHPDNNDAAR